VDTKKFALIVAGGSGSRMKSDIPKQFIAIHGKPMLMHTMEAFYRNDPDFSFVVVLPGKEIALWNELCRKHSFEINHKVTAGGKTRFHSVKNGLEQIQEEGIVFIHDGVRPLVSSKTIESCYQMALEKGNALPVIAPSESVREITGNENRAADRKRFFLVQTPQTFRVSIIKIAFNQKYSEKFTDDAAVLENTGVNIYMVNGNRENIKITYPEDLTFATILLHPDSSQV
jgi:2-C-methyl-D-erythritol 4-phosphate cytidylyltransferase